MPIYKKLLDEDYAMSNQGRGWRYQPKRRLRLITFTETLIIINITKTESNNCSFYTLNETKYRSHVFASLLTVSKTKRANLSLRDHAPRSYMT